MAWGQILELRRILAAKERSLDSLRETLTTTKRNLEDRCITAETTLAAREHDCERLLEEVCPVPNLHPKAHRSPLSPPPLFSLFQHTRNNTPAAEL